MGVPKFFRYISERYPCLSETVKEYQIPEFDNLYLDMNGIIHTCSHPDDGDPHFRITEEKILVDIFHYIEVLFRMIKPRKLFFMAVDGVAPRAKMNQQRGRRFRSAKEAQVLEAKAREKGEVLPSEARFDSNCITPGTVFMTRLHEQLKYFIVNKISNDKLWQNCKVILSGHETPGEGEHKIMDYIRYMRSQAGYDPNTRHCLYGLDADLIMLGLCTHEPHFSLLREEVKFGKKANKRKNVPEQITFFLLHLSLMREYLELEFYSLKKSLTFDYDMEKIIDDWVLMGFLVGNDFIPHLPNMHITNGALPILYNAYMKALPKLGGYINEGGILNLERFQAFMEELSTIDIDNFSEKYADLKWFEGKTGRRLNDATKSPIKQRKLESWTPDDDLPVHDEPLEPTKNSDLAALIKATNDLLLEPSAEIDAVEKDDDVCEPDIESDADASDTDDADLFNAEFLQHKTDYYMNKLEYAQVTPEVLRSQAEEYVRAIQWNLHYYYNGVCSWGWYYPHHYAPYVSDIKGFSDLKLIFDLGTPFKPFEQLLAVLPAASKSLLPEPYQELMVQEESLIKAYYPEDFKTDLNGKRQEWEAVVLIPFIDEELLLKAMGTCNDRLTPEEQRRNSHGPMLVYQFTPEELLEYQAPQYFPPVGVSHAKCKMVDVESIHISKEMLIKGAYPGVKFDVYYPGFPTMKHLEYKGALTKMKVKVFEQPSKGDNMILQVIEKPLIECEDDDDEVTLDAIAKELLGTTVHVGWPHLVEALVVSVSNREYRYHSAGEKGQYNVEQNKGNLGALWNAERQAITEYYQNRLGVEVGHTDTLVHVKVMVGRKYMFSNRGRISLEKQWAIVTSAYPLQTIVRNISVYEQDYVAYKDIASVFPTGASCFMLGQPGYGVMAEILDSTEALKEGRVKISLKKCDEPDLMSVIQSEHESKVQYMQLHVAATRLAISKGLFSRITGSVFIAPGSRNQSFPEDSAKVNIGLNLKFNKKNEEVPGYSKKEGNIWMYSWKAINLVREYMDKFPYVFQYLNCNVSNDIFYEDELFPNENPKEMIKEITTWMKKQPYYTIERQVCGSLVLDPDTVKMLEHVIDDYNSKSYKAKQLIIKVRPHLLYKPDIQFGNLMPDPAATFQLYDRIVNVREGYTVPLGYKGTIIGVHKPGTSKDAETMYDVLFDQPFAGGLALNCSHNRGYRMPAPSIINMSHGQRVIEQKTGKPGFSAPQQNTISLNYQGPPPFNHSQFQPQSAAYPNWSGNYPSKPSPQPVHNYKQYNNYNNYRQEPSYGPTYQNYNQNFNNGPNSFTPYKSHPITHAPMPSSPRYGPQKGNYSNSQNTPRDFFPSFPNVFGTEESREQKEKGENKNVNTKISILNRQVSQTYKTNETHANTQPKDDAELLKKMLKINDNATSLPSNNKQSETPELKRENSVPLSVEDLFSQARKEQQQIQIPHQQTMQQYPPQQPQFRPVRNQQQTGQQQPIYNTAQLQREFQARFLGIPQYQYMEVNKQFIAKLQLANGDTFLGDAANSREEAAESVAGKVLRTLQGQKYRTHVKPPLDAVPEPPKKWHESTNQHSQSPPKSFPRSPPKNFQRVNKPLFSNENRKMDNKRPERQGRMDLSQIHSHLSLEPPANAGTSLNSSDNVKDKVPRPQKNAGVNNSPFIPLQAVRRARTSSNTNESAAIGGTEKEENKNKAEKNTKVAPSSKVVKESEPSKPRRERKMRIAANFSTTMS